MHDDDPGRCGGTGMVAYWDGSAYAGEMCRGCIDCEGPDEQIGDDMAHPQQHFGTIKKVVRDKGFGFLQAGNGTEYFFHRSACSDFDQMFEGAAVRFVEGPAGQKGPRAERVELLQ